MNEAAFSNCSAEGYINRDKDMHTDPGPVDINELLKNFREEREEEESDTVMEEQTCRVKEVEKFRVKTYQVPSKV
jgi:ribonucleotide reductase beta subunit family protein with ferritin-like domain